MCVADLKFMQHLLDFIQEHTFEDQLYFVVEGRAGERLSQRAVAAKAPKPAKRASRPAPRPVKKARPAPKPKRKPVQAKSRKAKTVTRKRR